MPAAGRCDVGAMAPHAEAPDPELGRPAACALSGRPSESTAEGSSEGSPAGSDRAAPEEGCLSESSGSAQGSNGSPTDGEAAPKRGCGAGAAVARLGAAAGNWLYPLADKGGGGGAGAPRLDALDAPRWVASIQIVCYHMYENSQYVPGYKRYATWMATWTQLFFLLSGFVLAYAELSKPPKTGSARPSLLRYVRRRLTVIYPAFFLSLLLKVAASPAKTAFEWSMLPLHVLLLQSWFPICQEDGGSVSCSPWLFNGESWFLSVLLLFWLFLRPLAEFFRRRSACFCAATMTLCWAFSLVFHFMGHGNRLADLFGCTGKLCPTMIMVAIRSGPLGYVHVFVAGVSAARLFMLAAMVDADTRGPVQADSRRVALKEDGGPFVLRYGCVLGYALYAVLLFAGTTLIDPLYYFFHNGGMLPVMLLVLLGAAIGRDPLTVWVFRSKPLLVLGRISYMQYLMQHVLQGWIRQNFGWKDSGAIQAGFVPCLLLFSYCCQRWVEKPYTEYQRWKQEKKIKGVDDRAIEWLEARFAKGGAWNFFAR